VCLAIPGHIIELVDGTNGQLVVVDVLGVCRNINVGLLEEDDPAGPGDWILIHMGFALSKVTAAEAAACLDGLKMLGSSGEADDFELVRADLALANSTIDVERRTA
jgi:hydrogenase expression/formation protein HypC